MFAYDLASGKSSAVCKRISCTHRTADCPLHPLYQGDSGQESGYWNLIDNRFIAPKLTKDKFLITSWDAFTDKTEITELGSYEGGVRQRRNRREIRELFQ